MSKQTINGLPLHDKVKMYAEECKAGLLTRREFVTRATALGATTATAFALIGASQAEAAKWVNPPKKGGTLRLQQRAMGSSGQVIKDKLLCLNPQLAI